MILIIADKKNFFCKRCMKAHGNLYKDKSGNSFCDKCVPEELKDAATRMNQNRELI